MSLIGSHDPLAQYHDFFVAAVSAAGALVGLLFVAITVAQDRAEHGDRQHRIRAASAFTAFTNVLTISLLGLVPGVDLATVTIWVGAAGVAFVTGAALALWRLPRSWTLLRDALSLAGLAVIFGFEVATGAGLEKNLTGHAGDLQRLSILLTVSALFGIARAWALIEGPNIGVTSEVADLVVHAVRSARRDRPDTDTSADRASDDD